MSEIKILLEKSYEECCEYFKRKYGDVKGSYFINDSFKTLNTKIKRSKEGLFIHHIDEDKIENLSTKEQAKKFSFEFQMPDRLVYCNLLEHFLLHSKIFEKKHNENPYELIFPTGTMLFILPDLYDVYCGIEYSQEYRRKMADIILDRKQEYFECLHFFISIFFKILKSIITREYEEDDNEDDEGTEFEGFWLEIFLGTCPDDFMRSNLFTFNRNIFLPNKQEIRKKIRSIFKKAFLHYRNQIKAK